MTKTSTSTSTSTTTKVNAFLEAEKKLKAFKEANKKIFQQLDSIVEEYNAALEDADKEVRALGISVGPFSVMGVQTTIDVDILYDEMGPEGFLKVGGIVQQRQVLDIDKTKFQTYVNSGAIDPEILSACYSKKNKYRTPKKIDIP